MCWSLKKFKGKLLVGHGHKKIAEINFKKLHLQLKCKIFILRAVLCLDTGIWIKANFIKKV